MPTDPSTPHFEADDLIAPPGLAEEDAATLPLEPITHHETQESRVIEIDGLSIRGTLGEGGFGIVYLAEQTEPVHRLVALKVIKPGMDSRAIVARFEAERQALALMDHPGVARVFDGGTTSTGRPYFVMEYVAGEPITRFCDRQRMGISDRLELFIQTCEAIQHAHGKGVIHRDIKPSNILVEFVDNKPTVKVIDFGVAKALNQRLSDKTIFTAQGQLIGTPEYISPEQAEMTGVDVDTRSDVYSLGVILYELLTGTRPFSLRAHKQAGFSEIQRVIREVDPPRPSHRMTRLATNRDDDTAITAAKKRRIEPNQLVKRLRGDLDWVAMKCLEKNRDRRYETAHEVAAEIRRHLNDEPVLAGPPSTRYRFRKFAKRKMGLLIASSVIVLLLIGGIATTSTLLIRAMAAEKKHDTAETRVRQQLTANAADLIDEIERVTATPSTTAFDFAGTMARLADDEELLSEAAVAFVEDAGNLLEEMRRALAEEDGVALGRAGHALKGAAAIFGGDQLVGTARGLEDIAASGNLAPAEDAVWALETLTAQLLMELAPYISRFAA